MSTSALADFRIRFHDSFGDSGGAGHGGEFSIEQIAGHEFDVEPISLPGSLGGILDRFETFCLERTEFINFSSTFIVELNTEAVHGGPNDGPDGPSGGDLLDSRTAYLYSQFVTGSLSDYVYDSAATANGNAGKKDRTEAANALQNVIWFLEDEIDDAHQGLNSYERGLADLFLADANSNAGSGIGNVLVMNVFKLDGTHAQDQLVMFPEPIPAPGAAILACVGLGMVSTRRRRNRLA